MTRICRRRRRVADLAHHKCDRLFPPIFRSHPPGLTSKSSSLCVLVSVTHSGGVCRFPGLTQTIAFSHSLNSLPVIWSSPLTRFQAAAGQGLGQDTAHRALPKQLCSHIVDLSWSRLVTTLSYIPIIEMVCMSASATLTPYIKLKCSHSTPLRI